MLKPSGKNPPPSAASDPSPRLPQPYELHRTPPPPSPQPFAAFLIVSLGSKLHAREKKLPLICFSAAGLPRFTPPPKASGELRVIALSKFL
jgi:hypothetical protein